MRRTAIVTGAVLASMTLASAVRPAAQTPATQGPQMTFRLETNYVEVDAIVTDARGNFVRDLRQGDFEITEDKQTQAVDTFALVDIPLERADKPLYRAEAVEPDVVSNEREFDGRIYLIVLDGFHVAAARTPEVKKHARDFVEKYMAANDMAAIVQIGRTDISQDFTSNKRLLVNAIDKFMGSKLPSAAINMYEQAVRSTDAQGTIDADQRLRDMDRVERVSNAQASLESLGKLSNYMIGMRGRRKAVLLFSEGLDYDLTDLVGNRSSEGIVDPVSMAPRTSIEASLAADILTDMRKMFEATTRANVAIYTVDPRGPIDPLEELITVGGQVAINPAAEADTSSASLTLNPSLALTSEVRRSQGYLRELSNNTGGLATVGTAEFDKAFGRIVQENSTYYVLGYHAPPKHDGKFHNLTVRVNRPGVVVRARKGYYAARVDPKAQPLPEPDMLAALLNSPMAVGGLPMRGTAAVLRGTAPKTLVQLTAEVAGSGLTFQDRIGQFASTVDLAYIVIDATGDRLASGTKSLDLTLTAENRDAVRENGLRYTTELQLPPGRYQIRLAGRELVSDRSGSVFWDLEVPDLTKSALDMSSLLLTSSRAGAAPTVNDAATLKGVLPGPATAERDFTLEDTLAVYAEIYDNTSAPPHTVDLSVVVRTDDGTQVFATEDHRESRGAAAGRGGFGYLSQVPLQDLVPGRFVLTVEARSRLGGDPVKRETEFRIR
jgi:VWFA-related protein